MDALFVTDAVVIPPNELTWQASRASGKGGQNVNKVSTKVELRFDAAGSQILTGAQKARLRARREARFDADGWVIVVSQKTRDQSRNLEDARDKLRALIAAALIVPVVRRATRPTAGSRRRRLSGKHALAEKKQSRNWKDE
jgi:ribosome-associated protein